MRFAMAGLLLVAGLGCGGLFAQSFDQGFVPTCVDEHASEVAGLTDPDAACQCAKAKVEQDFTAPSERLSVLLDREQMKQYLEACQAESEGTGPDGAEAEEPAEIEDVEAPAAPTE